MEIEMLIDELESELIEKKGIFSKKIDINRCAELVYAIKEALPDAFREADYILSNKNKILENADNVAKNTIREAEERAVHLIGDSELIKRAEIEAKRIVDASYMQSNTLIDRTKSHLDAMFKDVEQFLLSNLNMIRSNREELRNAVIMKKS